MRACYLNENTIVGFSIGRGGRFNNGGYLEFLGVGNIRYFANMDKIFSPEDDNPESEWHNCNGGGVELTNEMWSSGIGRIDLDGIYDTTYTKYLKDVEIDSEEFEAIKRGYRDVEQAILYLRPELQINDLNEFAGYINHMEGWDSFTIEDIIKYNEWEDETGEEFGVCSDGDNKIILDNNGVAIVVE